MRAVLVPAVSRDWPRRGSRRWSSWLYFHFVLRCVTVSLHCVTCVCPPDEPVDGLVLLISPSATRDQTKL